MNNIITKKQIEDFSFYEESILQLKELYKYILLNQIRFIPELNNIEILKDLIYYTGRPFSDIIHTENIEKNYDINRISLLFNIAERANLKHLVSIINFTGFFIIRLYQILLKFYKIKHIPTPQFKIKETDGIKIEYLKYVFDDNVIYTLKELSKEYCIIPNQAKIIKLDLIKNNRFIPINYIREIHKTKEYVIIPTNLFKIILTPFYRLKETIWYECKIEYKEIKKYLKKLVFLNSPLEFLFDLEILVSEDFQSYNLIGIPDFILKKNQLFDFVQYKYFESEFNSILIANEEDYRENYFRKIDYIYDPNILCPLPIFVNSEFSNDIVLLSFNIEFLIKNKDIFYEINEIDLKFNTFRVS